MKIMSHKSQAVILAAVTLAVFYPAVFSEICLVDDVTAMHSIMNTEQMSLKEIFMPNVGGGGYYRPMIPLTYLIEKKIWLMDTMIMHLDNVLMHCLNVILVFLLVKRVMGDLAENSLVPFLAAVLFGLHPVTTESVNWISGRTDLLAGNFVLMCTLALYRYKDSKKLFAVVGAVLLLICALLAKETAFGFLPAALLILSERSGGPVTAREENGDGIRVDAYIFSGFCAIALLLVLYVGSYWAVLALGFVYFVILTIREKISTSSGRVTDSIIRPLIWSGIVFAATIGLFYLLRRIAFKSDIDKISMTIKLMLGDINYTISVFLGAASFYLKKLFQPYPLNFYIREIDPLYSLAGIILLFVCIRCLRFRGRASVLFLAGFCLILPVLPFAFGTIAWTSYAERYIYISSAFWIVWLSIIVAKFLQRTSADEAPRRIAVTVAATVILMLCTVTTLRRNFTWQTNIGILSDTVRLSPEAKPLRGLLMLAYSNKGNFAAAREQYFIASSLYSLQYDERFEVNMAGLETATGQFELAEKYYRMAIDRTQGKSVVSLNAYLDFLDAHGLKSELTHSSHVRKNRIHATQVEIATKLYEVSKNPEVLYRLGKYSLAAGSKDEAADYFTACYKAAPENSQLKGQAQKSLQRLNGVPRHTL